jgi:hypothetical protein
MSFSAKHENVMCIKEFVLENRHAILDLAGGMSVSFGSW